MKVKLLTWSEVEVPQPPPRLKLAQAILLGALPEEFWQGIPVVQTVEGFASLAGLSYQVALRALNTLPNDHFQVSGDRGVARTLKYLKGAGQGPHRSPLRRLPAKLVNVKS